MSCFGMHFLCRGPKHRSHQAEPFIRQTRQNKSPSGHDKPPEVQQHEVEYARQSGRTSLGLSSLRETYWKANADS